jgi:hypothetical protein
MEISKLSVCLFLIGIGLGSTLVGLDWRMTSQGSDVAKDVTMSVSRLDRNLTTFEGKNVTVIGLLVNMNGDYVLRDEIGAAYIALNLSSANMISSTLQNINGKRVVVRGVVVVNASFAGIDVYNLTII